MRRIIYSIIKLLEFKESKKFKGVNDNSLFVSSGRIFRYKAYVFNFFNSLNFFNFPTSESRVIYWMM